MGTDGVLTARGELRDAGHPSRACDDPIPAYSYSEMTGVAGDAADRCA